MASITGDLSKMADNPPKNTGHRRAHSEIVTLSDDISFESDMGVVGDPPLMDDNEEDVVSVYIDMDKVNTEFEMGEGSRLRHYHSQSMDETALTKAEVVGGGGGGEEVFPVEGRKIVSAAELAELALVDPKRAKRIFTNRQSAARSKERKMKYMAELERKVETLKTEATSLSTQLTLLQSNANGLAVENNELKLRLQTMEQQVHLQDELNDTLRNEVQHLKIATDQAITNCRPMMNFPTAIPGNRPFFPNNNPGMNTMMTAQQFQQLQINSQQIPFQHPPFLQAQQPLPRNNTNSDPNSGGSNN